ncbi:MAG: hypothetical protein HYY44_01110 [Deltaproteobacteria bacterium]|nr:hypothetical protein [Deltaproteobacteria bacterium]MBI4374066.1 hypothetical protein [Deltaproteobacteria bacterium]
MKNRLKEIMVAATILFGLSACGIDFDKDDSMSETELKYYMLGSWYYERELHCSYYPKDCPSEEEEVIFIERANDPDNEDKTPIVDTADPNKVAAYGFDTDGDGFVDVVAADSDGDGIADKILYIDNEDRVEVGDGIDVAKCEPMAATVDDRYGHKAEVTARLCEIDGGKADEETIDDKENTGSMEQ